MDGGAWYGSRAELWRFREAGVELRGDTRRVVMASRAFLTEKGQLQQVGILAGVLKAIFAAFRSHNDFQQVFQVISRKAKRKFPYDLSRFFLYECLENVLGWIQV